MAKLRECPACGEWRRYETADLCKACYRRYHNHAMLRDKFFWETRVMIKRLTGEDIYGRIELPFATKAK